MPACELFLLCNTQWRIGNTGPHGLDYAGVETVARLRGIDLTAELFGKIQYLESEYLRIVREKNGEKD